VKIWQKVGEIRIGGYFLCMLLISLITVYVNLVLDNPLFETLPPLPEGFVTPEPLIYRWPKYELEFVSSSGKKMATYEWHPNGPSKAIVFLFPGYADHSENNAHVAFLLVQQEYSAFAIDPIGHGRSEGLRGLIENFNQSIDDTLRWIRQVRARFGNKTKAFLFGGSMGGAYCLHLLLKTGQEFDGAFMSAPAIKASDDLYPILRKLARFAAELIPAVPIAPSLSDIPSCMDENINIALKSDPLFYNGRMRPKTGLEYMKNFEYLTDNLENINEPFLVMHGEDDVIIKYADSSKLLYERATSLDKTIKVLKGERHNFLQSYKWKEYVKEIIEWFDRHL